MNVTTEEMKRAAKSLGLDEDRAIPKPSYQRERAELKWSALTGGERDEIARLEAYIRARMGIPAPVRKPSRIVAVRYK